MYHRVGFTAAQSAELWERWKKGEGLTSIGRAFGKPSSCIFAHLRPSGGIMPSAWRRLCVSSAAACAAAYAARSPGDRVDCVMAVAGSQNDEVRYMADFLTSIIGLGGG